MDEKKEKIQKILDKLEQEYPDAECALIHKNPYELLVAVTLSAQTTDVSVNKISGELFRRYPNPEAMANGDLQEVMKQIQTLGMYKTKAKHLIAQGKMLIEEFEGNVPEDDLLLQKLPGVGRKTANVVMAVAFGHQRIAVDTHVFRVSNRIGLVSEDNVLDTEKSLMKVVPKKRWSRTHHSLIFHGRNCCKARKPLCNQCVIEELCIKKIK